MSADDRAALERRRAALVAKYTADEESIERARSGAVGPILWVVGVFALIAVFNLEAGHPGAALVAGLAAAFLGVVACQRLEPARLEVFERPPIPRIDAALAADEVRVIDLRVDAAVAVRGHDKRDEPTLVGHLLRTGPDQVIYLSAAACSGVDPEQLPSTTMRITCSENLELVRVEALGQRCELLATVEADPPGDWRWRSEFELIVWTPSEDRFVLLELGSSEMPPYSDPLDFDFRKLTAALMPRIYR